ncbi:MAG: hypothetical protein IPH72_22685 [Sandaracinaceae bacterium]|nr:hypothetical protein [Sandaracinaceae bacterium]MBK8592272.1 hypothetical protein [Sandaracinaceae bacterium]
MTDDPHSDHEVPGHEGEIARVQMDVRAEQLHVLAGGRVLVCAPGGTTLLVDSATGEVLFRERAECLAVSPRRDSFAVALYGTTGALNLWIDAATGVERARSVPMPSVLTMAFSDGGRIAWSTFAPPVDYGEVVIWEPQTNTHTTYGETERLGPLLFLDETRVAAARHGDLWIFEPDAPARRLRVGTSSARVCRMPSGHALVAEVSGRVVQLDVQTAETLCLWDAEGRGELVVAYDAHGSRLLRRPRYPGAASFVEWKTLGGTVQHITSPSGEGPFLEAAWVPASEDFVTCTARAVYRVHASTGQLEQVFRTYGAALVALGVGVMGAVAWATANGELHLGGLATSRWPG